MRATVTAMHESQGGLPPLAAEAALLEAYPHGVRHDMADAANQHSYS